MLIVNMDDSNEFCDVEVHLKRIKTAVMLSQPMPDMVSGAINLSNESSTTFLVSFFLRSYFTISMIPWLFYT